MSSQIEQSWSCKFQAKLLIVVAKVHVSMSQGVPMLQMPWLYRDQNEEKAWDLLVLLVLTSLEGVERGGKSTRTSDDASSRLLMTRLGLQSRLKLRAMHESSRGP